MAISVSEPKKEEKPAGPGIGHRVNVGVDALEQVATDTVGGIAGVAGAILGTAGGLVADTANILTLGNLYSGSATVRGLKGGWHAGQAVGSGIQSGIDGAEGLVGIEKPQLLDGTDKVISYGVYGVGTAATFVVGGGVAGAAGKAGKAAELINGFSRAARGTEITAAAATAAADASKIVQGGRAVEAVILAADGTELGTTAARITETVANVSNAARTAGAAETATNAAGAAGKSFGSRAWSYLFEKSARQIYHGKSPLLDRFQAIAAKGDERWLGRLVSEMKIKGVDFATLNSIKSIQGLSPEIRAALETVDINRAGSRALPRAFRSMRAAFDFARENPGTAAFDTALGLPRNMLNAGRWANANRVKAGLMGATALVADDYTGNIGSSLAVNGVMGAGHLGYEAARAISPELANFLMEHGLSIAESGTDIVITAGERAGHSLASMGDTALSRISPEAAERARRLGTRLSEAAPSYIPGAGSLNTLLRGNSLYRQAHDAGGPEVDENGAPASPTRRAFRTASNLYHRARDNVEETLSSTSTWASTLKTMAQRQGGFTGLLLAGIAWLLEMVGGLTDSLGNDGTRVQSQNTNRLQALRQQTHGDRSLAARIFNYDGDEQSVPGGLDLDYAPAPAG